MLDLIASKPWDAYAARVAELYPPLAADDGYEEAEIAASEVRLGFRLPRILREFYLLAGRRNDLTRQLTQPIPPDFLEIVGHALIFTHGDDDFPTCGVLHRELGQDDPSVARSEVDLPSFDWNADHDRLSTWFVSMLYYDAVRCGLPFHGSAPIDETELPAIAAHWPRVDLLGSLWDQRIVFHKAGQVVCVEGHAPDLLLLAGGRTREDLDTIARHLELEWEQDT
jgi:hypothetical protein